MKVHIYDIDQRTDNKGQLKGILTYLAQRLRLNTADKVLDSIVNFVYMKVRNGNCSGHHYTEDHLHQIQTAEFIQNLGSECWKNGYVIELVE